jgi:hypothetical protein
MLVPLFLSSATIHNAESSLKRYHASCTETVAIVDGPRDCHSFVVEPTIVCDESLRKSAQPSQALPGSSPSDTPCTGLPGMNLDPRHMGTGRTHRQLVLPGTLPVDAAPDPHVTKDGANLDPPPAQKQVMPTLEQLVKTRTGCVKKLLWLPQKTAPVVEEELQDAQRRPHASVNGRSALAVKTAGKRGSLQQLILDSAKPEVIDEGSMRSGKHERRPHRIPGEQPADAPIPDSTK